MVKTPDVMDGLVRDGLVRVLFVSVSVVARPTKVSVEVGSVRVPVLEIVEMTGLVKVLLVRVSVELIVGTFTPSTVILPAAPLAKVVSEACPRPMTAPAATKAPSKPTIKPRTIFDDETNFPP